VTEHQPIAAAADPDLLVRLARVLPAAALLTGDAIGSRYQEDRRDRFSAPPRFVLRPATTGEMAAALAACHDFRQPVVVQGGRTGLSGAHRIVPGEAVLSLERLVAMGPVDRDAATVEVQAGVTLQQVQEAATEAGLMFGVDIGARGSATIGGNIATNAGGIKVIRYGLTRDWVTGLKVVTGRGDLLDLNRGLIKNATGYDLRHLFIGSEGTLGLIVEATLKLARPLREPSVLVLGVPDLNGIMAIYDLFRRKLELTAFEFFSELALRHVLNKGLHRPFDSETPYYVLIEFENPDGLHTDEALALFEQCAEQGWLADGVISQSEAQAKELWRLREDISESIAEHQPYKNDIAVRIARVPALLAEMDELLQREYPDFEVLWYGHIGDGNLHINILKPADRESAAFAKQCGTVSEHLFEALQRYGGSISAEHGVGLTKKPYLHYTRDEAEISYLRAIKQVFDPQGIMNPGKIFD